MSKLALVNLTDGTTVITKGKIYKDEDVAQFDSTNFQDVAEDANAELRTGVVGENEVKETIEPELDTQVEEVEKKNSEDETDSEDKETISEDEEVDDIEDEDETIDETK